MFKFRRALIAIFVVGWGIVTLVGELFGVKFDIYWFAIIAIILGLLILSNPKLRRTH